MTESEIIDQNEKSQLPKTGNVTMSNTITAALEKNATETALTFVVGSGSADPIAVVCGDLADEISDADEYDQIEVTDEIFGIVRKQFRALYAHEDGCEKDGLVVWAKENDLNTYYIAFWA